MDLDRVLAVFRALKEEGVDYILVGGAAMNVHGLVRATEDVDLFIKTDAQNIAGLRRALRRVWDDPEIEQITVDDLAGDYAVVRYGPPDEDFVIDIMSRLGDAFVYEDLQGEDIELGEVTVRVATPATLYKMKRDTVRPIDKADAEALERFFGLGVAD